jgi:hypothetical protein
MGTPPSGPTATRASARQGRRYCTCGCRRGTPPSGPSAAPACGPHGRRHRRCGCPRGIPPSGPTAAPPCVRLGRRTFTSFRSMRIRAPDTVARPYSPRARRRRTTPTAWVPPSSAICISSRSPKKEVNFFQRGSRYFSRSTRHGSGFPLRAHARTARATWYRGMVLPLARASATSAIIEPPPSGFDDSLAASTKSPRSGPRMDRWSRGGCARMPVGTHPHLLVVGAGNPIAVLGMARLGARRGGIRRRRSTDQQLQGSLFMYPSVGLLMDTYVR